jgi:DNA-binding CsgD family transcriptional regulator
VADLLLDGLALLVTDGPATAAPVLRQAISTFADPDVPLAERLRWSWWAPVASLPLWDVEGYRLIVPPLQLARDVGALDQLPMLLNVLAVATALRGDLAAAASLIAEADAAREATGARLVAYAAMALAAFRGSQAEVVSLIEATLEQAAAVGQGAAVTWAHWGAAVLHNGLGHYQEALDSARQAAGHRLVHLSMWALPELVEAAARTGNTGMASDALDQLSEWTQAGRTDWGLGVEARSRALLSEGEAADRLYREAIDRLGHTAMRPDLARTQLLYGEWLRRQRRHGEARVQLRTAHNMLDAMGMEGFAARARGELRATGETARKRSVATMLQLTAQEAQIARLARDGLSNPEIGARLFLSRRTVQYHLGKVFTKLDITSRSDLRRILPAHPDATSLR